MLKKLPSLLLFIAFTASLALLPAGTTSAQPMSSPASGAQSGTDEEPEVPTGATEINLKNAEISSIIRIFSRRTGRNYILDENVKGKVTIYLPGKVQTGEAIKILDSILSLKGFTSVPIGENLWKIIPNKDAKTATIPTLQGLDGDTGASAAMVTRIVNLKYSGADDVKQLVTPLISPEGLINAYTGTNSLIIIDAQDNIDRVVGIIETLDVASSDREMTIIPVLNAEATDIAEKLNEILGVGSGKESEGASSIDLLRNRVQEGLLLAGRNPPGGGTSSMAGGSIPPAFAAGKTVTAKSREPKITADERTNSIIVVADDDTTARVRALIAQLDSKVDRSGNKFYVYRCQHANAEELAEVLSGLGGGSSGSGGSSGNSNPADFFGGSDRGARGALSSRGTNGRDSSRNRSQSRLNNQSRTPGESRSGNRSAGPSSASLGENVSITADPATNSLIIFASKPDYQKVLELLRQIDVKRRQVLVEATLLEVALDGSLATGLNFMGSTGGADGGAIIRNDSGELASLLRNPASIQNFSIAAASAGSLKLPNGDTIPTQSLLVTAAQSNRNVNVLSAPTILTTDNEEAEIVVGQNVPFISSTSTNDTNLNNTFNQVDRQDVGITLRLTPQISSGDFVTLKIFTEVSDLVPGTASSTLGPTTTVRTSETTVITKDSQMVVIGGLMSDDVSDGEAGIPYLKDIPVLGHLFKTSTNEHRRTNLLIFITPRIIKDQFDHREITVTARDTIDREIRNNPEAPDRAEVLYRDELSNVAEGTVVDGPKPSTILPPLEGKPEVRENEQSSKQNTALRSTGPSGGTASGDSAVFAARVRPKAPSVKASEPSTSTAATNLPELQASAATSRTTTSKASTLKANPLGERYVVLERLDAPQSQGGEHERLPQHGKFVGIIIPEGTPSNVDLFFSPGKRIKAHEMEVRSAGIFLSPAQASSISGSKLPNDPSEGWYRLTPHEILNLGKGNSKSGSSWVALSK